MSGNEIRETFLKFFESKGHRRVHSSSLVPHNDPTLLFTNAGMNQFKDLFLGNETRDYNRATTSQKCVRAGGKHNDLENVGFTRRHHTFFEMLGNFSFGDYFKREAIAYAWELVTSDEWFGIPKDKLYVTIFEGADGVPRDDEAEQYWLEVGVPKERIFEMGMKDNFWAMGDTGPCGPCSEIFYDMGIGASETPDRDLPFPQDDARYVEIWNLVFMQFERDSVGTLNLLPKPSIDTGMGLERTAAVLQGVISNYDTDLFTKLTDAASILTGVTIGDGDSLDDAALRIIADHARAATFLISDGVLPANEGRGYVLRKILRRAIRHGRNLLWISGHREPGKYQREMPFLYKMVDAVRDLMIGAYPELADSASSVARIVEAEERQFARVLSIGSQRLEQLIAEVKNNSPHYENYFLMKYSSDDDSNIDLAFGLYEATQDLLRDGLTQKSRTAQLIQTNGVFSRLGGGAVIAQNVVDDLGKSKSFPGKEAFHLYETYGLPFDFIQDACRDAGVELDLAGFEQARAAEQARARASWKGGSQKSASPVFRELPKTGFAGYRQLTVQGAEVLAIVKDGLGVQHANPGEEVELVLDQTSFYADSGGQVGDIGWLYSDDHNSVVAEVSGATKPVQGVFAHKALVRQPIRIGDKVDTVVDADYRNATRRNHTGTHLLHAGLREVLGKHVKQAGSLVDDHRLRFDFSHFAAIADEELQNIEDIVNKQVLANASVVTLEDVPIDVAVNEYHAMALFGEKYGDKVRVVKIGDFSTELCGGTHTNATGEIGTIKLLGEGSVSSGVRRVEAVTGLGALKEFRRDYAVAQVANQLAPSVELSPADSLRNKLAANEEELKKLRRELDEARMKSAASSVSSAADQAVEVNGVKVLAQKVGALDRAQLRVLVDNLRNKLGSGVVVLGSAQEDGKVALIVGVTKDLTGRLQAGKIIAPVAKLVGGSGGGRPDMAEAGGKDAHQLDAALASVKEVVAGLLG
jgi:alanyl-tRNA synthetase